MLNERKEAEGYLCEPDSDDTRLGAKLLSDNFKGDCKLNGIADVLTLVACHYLYGFSGFGQAGQKAEEMAVLIMRVWCGFENDVTEDELRTAKEENEKWFKMYPQAEGWLRTYHGRHLKEKSDDWTAYSRKWKKHLNSENLYQAESLCYGNILAQAARGPLKSYALVIKNDYEKALKNEIRNQEGKAPDVRRQRTILKLIAAYKVLQLLHPGQKYVLLQTNRILNWLGFDSDKEDRWCLDFHWRGEPVFLMKSYRDFKKFSVNQAFLEEMDVRLWEGVPESVPNGYSIYQDAGPGKKNGLVKLKYI